MSCKICLGPIKPGRDYHPSCKAELFGRDCTHTRIAEHRADLVQDMPKHTHGFSISGMQPKAQLSVEDGQLTLVERRGSLILKPSPESYPGVAENEHLTLQLMRAIGMDVPPCGLLQLDDGHLVFVIRRYDRTDEGAGLHQEDAMQAMGIANNDSDSKYEGASYLEVLRRGEALGGRVLVSELLERLVFSYLVGNDDHHLKNISFVHGRHTRLAPAYDVLNTTLHMARGSAMALRFFPVDHEPHNEPSYYRNMANGHYSGGDFVELGQAAGLPAKMLRGRITQLVSKLERKAPGLIERSYLDEERRQKYRQLISERARFLSVFDEN